MVQLVAYSQSGENPTYLDLGKASIKASFSSVEIQDISKRKSDFTHSFTLPFTSENNKFFSHYYEVNQSGGDFDATKKVKCSIYSDSNLQFEGYLQLQSVDIVKELYKVIAFGEVANIVKELGESKLSDLDFSRFNHILSLANVVDSWSGDIDYVGSQPNGAEVLYPIADFGKSYIGGDGGIGINSGAIKPRDLKPTIQLKTVFEEIISKAGYKVNSTFLNSTFFTSQYMTLGNDVEGVTVSNVDGFKVGKTTSQTISAGATNTIALDNEAASDSFYDIGGNFASSTYTVPSTGTYSFKGSIATQYTGSDSGNIALRIQVSGYPSAIVLGTAAISSTVEYNYFSFEPNASFTLQQGDTVTMSVFNDLGDSITILDEQTFGAFVGRSYLQLVSAPNIVEGATIDLSTGNSLFPKDKQADFLRSILNRYNLSIEYDKDNAKQLNIEPIQDYYNAGSTKDWTSKIDTSKGITIEPTSKVLKAEIDFKDLEDEDSLNVYWQENYNEVYNSYSKKFDNDFSQGKLELFSMFSSFNCKKLANINMFIPQSFKWDNGVATFVKTKPRIFYYSGLKDLAPSEYYKTYSEVTEAYTTQDKYPFVHHYAMSGNMVTESDEDTRFKSKHAYGFNDLVETQTGKDVYSTYWKTYLNNLYSPEARLMSANVLLDSVDISNFRYNDKIFIKDSYWRVNKIQGFAIGEGVSTKVEFVKIIENATQEGCNLTIDSYNVNNTTSWIDSSGSSATPTSECCLNEGLEWDGSNCLWSGDVSGNPIIEPPISWDNEEHTTGGTKVPTIKFTGLANTVKTSDDQNLHFAGSVKRLGKEASDGEVLTWNGTTEEAVWATPATPASMGGGGSSSPSHVIYKRDDTNYPTSLSDFTIGGEDYDMIQTNRQYQSHKQYLFTTNEAKTGIFRAEFSRTTELTFNLGAFTLQNSSGSSLASGDNNKILIGAASNVWQANAQGFNVPYSNVNGGTLSGTNRITVTNKSISQTWGGSAMNITTADLTGSAPSQNLVDFRDGNTAANFDVYYPNDTSWDTSGSDVGSKTLTFTLNANDGVDSATKTLTFYFYNRKYFGMDVNSTLSETQIKALPDKPFITGDYLQDETAVDPVGVFKYIYYIYPYRYTGTPSFKIGGFISNFNALSDIDIDVNGYTEKYKVWRSPQAYDTNTTFEVY